MLPLKMRSEMVIVLVFKPILDYLHENRESSLLVIEYVWEGWRSGWQMNLKAARMLPFQMRSETVIVCLSAILLSLCLNYLHGNQEDNRIKSAG